MRQLLELSQNGTCEGKREHVLTATLDGVHDALKAIHFTKQVGQSHAKPILAHTIGASERSLSEILTLEGGEVVDGATALAPDLAKDLHELEAAL